MLHFRTQELQLYLDRVSQLLRAGGRLRDVLASGAEEEAYQKAVLASLATDPGAGTRCLCRTFDSVCDGGLKTIAHN